MWLLFLQITTLFHKKQCNTQSIIGRTRVGNKMHEIIKDKGQKEIIEKLDKYLFQAK